MNLPLFAALGALALAPSASAQGTAPPANPIRRARNTGHVTNYDEARVGTYTLPDPLVLNDGEAVRDARTWRQRRRPEILELYRRFIYGRVPANAPAVRGEFGPATLVLGGAATRRILTLRVGNDSGGPVVPVALYLPAQRSGPVPVLLQITFRGDPPPKSDPAGSDRGARFSELGPIAEIIRRGYAYAVFRYTDFQPDTAKTRLSGVEALTAAPGSERTPDEWGTISVWAWGASRVLDWLSTDPAIDARRAALIGHSRLGKTVLWAGAQDPRFALVFSSCAGEMGSSLARRDYGETVDDMAANFPWQFAPNFQRYAGHWDRLPVDTHMIIALNAPHPVLITAGSGDQWADPRGEFLAEVAAGPVYRLLGCRDLGATEFPPLDTAVDSGDLAFRYHRGPHAILPGDWTVFLDYAARTLTRASQ